MAIKIENLDELDKVQVFSILLKEGMDGLKTHLDKVGVEQENIRTAAITLRKNFKKEMLFNFLTQNSSSDKEDKRVLLRKTGKGYALQNHILTEALDGQVQQILNDYVRKEYQGFSAIRPDDMKSKMLRYVISQLEEKQAFGGQGKESLSEVEAKDKQSAVERGESAGINKVLGNFKMKGKSTRYNLQNAEDALSQGISLASIQINIRELKEWQRTLESAPTQNMRRLVEPFLKLINGRLTTDSSISLQGVELDADMLIGKLDLKFLSRREEIYKYWETIDEKYEVVKTTVKDFADGLEEIKTDNDKLKEVIDNFTTVASRINTDEDDYKYILEYDGKPMKDWVKGTDKVQVLFETFLDTLDKKGADVDFDRKREELIEELGIDSNVSNEELGLEGAQGAEGYTQRYEGKEEKDIVEIDVIQAKEENTQVSRLGKKLGKLHETTKVDPLFYYVYSSENKNRNEFSAWAEWPIFSKEISRIKRSMKRLGDRSVTIIDDEIEEYVDKLATQAVVGNITKFYLPASERILDSGIIQTEDNDKINEIKNLKNISEFLEIVSKFLSSGSDLDKLASPTSIEERGKTQEQKNPEIVSATFGRKDRKNFLAEIKALTNEHKAMMDAILEYYIVPMSSRFKPFDDKIEFANTQLIQILTNAEAIQKDNSFFTLLAMEAEYGALLLDKDELEQIVNALEFITTPANKDYIQLRSELEGLQLLSIEILGGLGGNFKEDSRVELGTFLNTIITKNKLNDVQIFNKKTEEWKEQYNSQKIYPLEAIESHLNKNRQSYMDDPNTEKLARRFFSAIDDMQIVKSNTELKILDAHDTIRKMMDKPVYYNTSKLDNYNHVNTAIDILKKNYNVDVTVNEIGQIVNKIDSLESISKKHGIPVESVYYLKANFR